MENGRNLSLLCMSASRQRLNVGFWRDPEADTADSGRKRPDRFGYAR